MSVRMMHEIAYISDHKKWTTFDLYLLFKDYGVLCITH